MVRQQKIKIQWLLFTFYFVIMSVGLPLHKHYCMGDLKKVQLFIQPESCHSSNHNKSISDCCSGKHITEKGETCSTEERNCCSDRLEFYKIDVTTILQNSEKSKININSVFVINSNIFNFVPKNFNNAKLIKTRFNRPLKLPNFRTKIALYQQFIC